MILLPIQLRIFAGSVVMGWLMGVLYSLLRRTLRRWPKALGTLIIEALFHIAFQCLCFYLLFRLNGGRLRLYYVLLFLLGYYLYYVLYYPFFLPIYDGLARMISPIFHHGAVVFSKIDRIIKIQRTKMKRRMESHGKARARKKEAKKKGPSDH